MKFAHFFIDRPIFAAVVSIVTVIIGGIALYTLPVERHPRIAPPTVSVSATYPGANAKVVCETVATPIEQQVNGVEGMLYMSSQCTNDGSMAMTITFQLGTDIDEAQVLVQNRVQLAKPKLPEEARRQGITVRKRSPDLTLVVNLLSPDGRYDQVYLSNYALIHVRDVLARLPGVGDLLLFGASEYSMRIWLDPEKVAARNLTAIDVVNAIRQQNVQVASGTLGQPPVPAGTDLQLTVTTLGRLIDEDQFADIVVKAGTDGNITRLRDIARIELGAQSYSANLYNANRPAIGIVAFQLPGTNALQTKYAIVKAMEQLKQDFPEGLDYVIDYDTTVFVEESVAAVVQTLMEALVLVVLVVLVFLQNWRATLIPLLAVPVALIGTFAVLAAAGFSLNTLSLFGMVLAIGIVVDDAIVVVENVERNIEDGLDPRAATRKAMDEVSGPIVATALVLSAVFIPTAFITGLTGQFYRQFALTIAVSTILSAFNSLTLSPALAALLLQKQGARKDVFGRLLDLLLGWFFKLFNFTFEGFRRGYTWVLRRLVRLSAVVLLVYAGLLALTYESFNHVPVGFIPNEDQGYLIVFGQLPDGASLERTDAVSKAAAKMILETPGVRTTVQISGWSVLAGANQANALTIFVPLRPFPERVAQGLPATVVMTQLQQKLASIQEAYIAVFPPPSIRGVGSVGGFKMQVQDRADLGFDALQDAVTRLAAAANQAPGLVGAFSTFRASTPQIFLDVDRVRAQMMGVPLGNVFDTLQVYLGGLYVNDFNRFGRVYQVTAQAEPRFRLEAEDITQLKTRNRDGEMVPLGSLLNPTDSTGPDKVTRYNLFPAADLSGNTLPGVSTGDAIRIMSDLADRELPRGMGYEWTELTYQQILAGNAAIYIFPLCVLFVFLALAAQYESWSLPLAVVLIVPMCLLCAIAGVWFRGMDNNIFTQIGFVVLVGLACKNAILIVEFAKTRQEHGLSRFDAAVEAAHLRVRPILMTSFAFILGVVPLVVSTGAGAESRKALGTTVFSGMLGVTFFGLLLTPVFYVVIRKFVEWRERRRGPTSPGRGEDSDPAASGPVYEAPPP